MGMWKPRWRSCGHWGDEGVAILLVDSLDRSVTKTTIISSARALSKKRLFILWHISSNVLYFVSNSLMTFGWGK